MKSALTLASLLVASVAFAATAGPVLLPTSSPLVAIRLVFRTGSADDPAGKEGLAALTAHVMAEGATTSRTYPQIVEALYPLAADIQVQADKEMTVFYGTVHRDNLEKFVEILADQVLHPRFAEDDFARKRDDAGNLISKGLRGNNDEALGKEALESMIYAGHPYGHPNAGTVSGLRAITREDVSTFHRSHYTRDRLTIGIAGGYPESFAAEFERRFASLPATGAPATAPPKAPARAGNRVAFVEKSARANAVSIGAPISATRRDDDFYPLFVANSYLGEHRTFNGVLMNRLRGARGLNYGDYSYVENFVQEGGTTFPVPNIPRREQRFAIWIRPVAPENTLFAIRCALFYLHRLEDQGIPATDFEETRRFLQTYSKLWTQDVSRRLGYAIDARVWGRDIQAELARRLPTMTKAQVDAAVKKYLPRDGFDIAVVTSDAAKWKSQLLSGAPTPIHYDTEGTPADVLTEDKEIEKYPLPVSPGNVRIVPVAEMFDR
jgi:zinc protease